LSVRNYRELVAWQVAFGLTAKVYRLTEGFPKTEAFGLSAQMRRSAVSITSNLAEGAGRATKKDFMHFVTVARGSLNELETQYLLAKELGMCTQDDEAEAMFERLYGLINGLRNSLNA
jgi:four helix bundle protein